MRLFHFSEDPSIGSFHPRPAQSRHHVVQKPVVWAVGERGLFSYLVPRQCPRVTFWAQHTSSAEEIETFLGGNAELRVMVIESAWFERCLSTALFRYEFSPDHFYLHDSNADYYLSEREEVPVDVVSFPSPLFELVQMGVEVRVTPALWDIREQLFRTSLGWSFIRMVNATPPKQGYEAYLPV